MSLQKKGIFGHWSIDGRGLPVFEYSCNEFTTAAARYFTTFGGSNTHYHLLGNACWFGLATNHGQFFCLDPRRGFTMLGTGGKSTLPAGPGLVHFSLRDEKGTTWQDVNTSSNQPLVRRVFGAGYLEKEIRAGDLRLTSRILFPAGDDPVVIAECHLENATNQPRKIQLRTSWNLHHLPLSKSLIVSWNGRKHYQKSGGFNGLLRFATALQRIASMDTDGARKKHARSIHLNILNMSGSHVILGVHHVAARKHDPVEPANINFHFRPVAIACIDGQQGPARMVLGTRSGHGEDDCTIDREPGELSRSAMPNAEARVVMIHDLEIPPGTTMIKRFMLACANEDAIEPLLEKYSVASTQDSLLEQAAAWFKQRIVSFDVPGMPWLDREVTWHGTYMLSSMFKDEYHGFHRIPQASVYLLGHAFDGSIRDFSLFSYPLMFMDHALAREFLTFIYTAVDPRGKISYALHGFGKKLVVPGIHANPSDQYFFVTWATAEYIYTTRDFQFLDEQVVIKDEKGNGTGFAIKELLGLLLKYVISDEIGLGEHGMVRVRDGDWNDGISLMAKNRNAFIKDGESTFNSAMLILSFDKILPLVRRFDPGLATKMQATAGQVRQAIDNSWNGKWFFRGYDGKGNALGDDTLYLDHHAWMLQNRALPPDKMGILLDTINEVLISRSRCGAAIMHPQNPKSSILPPGWDINGGTWHALNSLLAWGLRVRNPALALSFLQRISMHNRAEQYPNTWYGIWSGPDAYNADDAERPGEAFFHSSTPMCDFPFMNNNLHAGFIAAAIHYAGIEADHDCIRIDVSASQPFSFASRVVAILKEEDRIVVTPGNIFKEAVPIEIVVPAGFVPRMKIYVEPASVEAVVEPGGVVRVVHDPVRPVREVIITQK